MARIELLYVPGCPLLDRVRGRVEDCLAEAGITTTVVERAGTYASPTLLIDGVDVVTGEPAQARACCRLELPTRDQILASLARSAS